VKGRKRHAADRHRQNPHWPNFYSIELTTLDVNGPCWVQNDRFLPAPDISGHTSAKKIPSARGLLTNVACDFFPFVKSLD
jgi:hypothetical protein